MIDFTVAIPTYNGAERLPQLLDKLRSQTGIESLSWAILVVDNNSQDATADIVRKYQKQWNDTASSARSSNGYPALNYATEKRQGAAFARIQAMEQADSPWVAFLDDDIVPADDWVAEAFAFATAHPRLGACGGQIHGDFEVEPPPNFARIQSFLAIRERGTSPHKYDPDNLSLPPSAAWIIRKQAWKENVSDTPKLGGRTRKSVMQGDDYEPLLYMHRANWEIWYNPAMHVSHQIPKSRLERPYLKGLSRGCGLCICPLRMINAALWQKPFIFIKLILSNLRRVVLHWIKYRRQISTDLVAACEMEFYLASFASPFYYLQTLLSIQK